MASITHRLAALNLRRSTDADFTLVCQGTEVKAHSFVLAVWSDYFESAQSGSWVENISKRIEFKGLGCVYFSGNEFIRTNSYNICTE